MTPTNKEEFKDYCLRRLGSPVIEINVENDQLDDRVDEALLFFQDYAFDGTEKTFYKYQVTPQDMVNNSIPVPPGIIGVIHVFPVGQNLATNNLFNIRYQIALNDLYDLTATSLTPYYLAMQNIQFIEQMLVGEQPFRFNKHTGLLHVDMDWTTINPGEYMVIEVYQIVDPAVYASLWNDRWLQRYATALIKRQWGSNLTKYVGVQLPGGNTFNGIKLYDDAIKEIEQLEKEVVWTYAWHTEDLIG